MNDKNYQDYFNRTSQMFSELANNMQTLGTISRVEAVMINALEANRNIFWCGNGGSASDAEHLAAELVGRFERNRRPLNSIALTTNSSTITAISNDFSFDQIFERQIEALGHKGDILVSISTSGESLNIVKAIQKARILNITTISLLGKSGGKALELSDHSILVNSNTTSHIQEAHIAIGQALCGQIEKHFSIIN